MENLEKKIFTEDKAELFEEPLFSNGFLDSMRELKYSVSISKEKNVAIIKNEYTELRIGYNHKEQVFYLSSYHKKGRIGNFTLMKLFNEEKYELKKEGSKVIIKNNNKELRINYVKEGERVKIIYSLSAIRSSVIKECIRLAKYYSEIDSYAKE